ncbi:MAG: DUF4147 domain-containing protein [Thiohalobacterales bacterium]|nr:DUF4147 domain-containing protein [Thiohalobacterales bacterium]
MTIDRPEEARALLLELFQVALAEVHGSRCVERYLRAHPLSMNTAVIAIGKAACTMLSGALEVQADNIGAALAITPAGQTVDCPAAGAQLQLVAGDHPVPGPASLAAGQRLLSFIDSLHAGQPLLFLISGGASSLVEVPKTGIGLADIQAVNRWLLGSGLAIGDMNRIRTALSRIKGGQLGALLGGRPAQVLLISDVPGDDPAVIGSGLLHPGPSTGGLPPGLPAWLDKLLEMPAPSAVPAGPVEHPIVGNNHAALDAIADHVRAQGLTAVIGESTLTGDVDVAAAHILDRLQAAAPGVYVWGGETTVRLPENPGTGGRNQQLALTIAVGLADKEGIVVLAVGTDGRDGNSEAAGAMVDARTVDRGMAAGLDAGHCLRQADAGSFLAASGDLINTGPTGTNVMDIVIAIKPAGSTS